MTLLKGREGSTGVTRHAQCEHYTAYHQSSPKTTTEKKTNRGIFKALLLQYYALVHIEDLLSETQRKGAPEQALMLAWIMDQSICAHPTETKPALAP